MPIQLNLDRHFALKYLLIGFFHAFQLWDSPPQYFLKFKGGFMLH